MNRRDFVAASCVAGLAPLQAASALDTTRPPDTPEYYELRSYHTHVGAGRQRLTDYLRGAAIPAWNRLGIGPVGVFSVTYGPSSPSLYVLLPHPTLDSIVTVSARLADDAEYRKAGAPFLDAPLDAPAFVRVESSLIRAFSHLPRLEAPAAAAENRPRIFELRVYESHSEPAARRKVEMFNEGGEIAIFRKTGLTPVFFGETLVGPRMPNLTYMLVFDDMAHRDRAWKTFVNDPDWHKLRDDPYYADTVSNITDYILRPEPFSQV